MIQFFETQMGKKFYQADLPRLIRGIEEKNEVAKQQNDLIKQQTEALKEQTEAIHDLIEALKWKR